MAAGFVALGIGIFAVVMIFMFVKQEKAFTKQKEVVVVRVSDAPSAPTKCFDCENQPRYQVFQSYGEPRMSLGA
jgi:hypothetical protein